MIRSSLQRTMLMCLEGYKRFTDGMDVQTTYIHHFDLGDSHIIKYTLTHAFLS
ncbi:hypothetical protein HanRHA438_Chr15g0717451 [Helianthus annuus]|nr:hypothetical protein HanRHA438_Chr15g0717451 [Helianthus annuus]